MSRAKKAAELFLSGYNCAQAVSVAFCDLTRLDEPTAARLASPFGGGIGRMREVCGAVSGMYMVLGILYGYSDAKASEEKKQLYSDVQALAEEFKKDAGSIICREILKGPSSAPTPSERTKEYYSSRPCARMVEIAATLLENYIDQH